MAQVPRGGDGMDKQMAVAMASAAGTSVSRLGLRFDRVVLRLLRELSQHCNGVAPEGTRVLMTVSAPIRLPARTADDLKQRMAALVREGPPPREQVTDLHGNIIGLRLVRAALGSRPRLLGLVHNPDKDSRRLLDLAERYAEEALGADAPCP